MEKLDSSRLRLSEKEKCFKEAMETYQKAVNNNGGKKLNWEVKDHQLWGQKVDGTWHQVNNMSLEELNLETVKTNSMIKKWINSGGDIGNDPFKAGKDYWYQSRVPDFTVRTPDGKTVVVDNKFTRKSDCSKDQWGKKKGYNGNAQREDYNNINEKNNPGDDNAQDLYLDRDICQCQAEPQAQEAQSPYKNPGGEQSLEVGAVDTLKGTRVSPPGSSGGLPNIESPSIQPEMTPSRLPETVQVPRPMSPVTAGGGEYIGSSSHHK